MPSWQKPTEEQIRQVSRLAVRPEEQRYFFANLQNPLWIDALNENENLEAPHPVLVDGSTSHPRWPISEYIARVAGDHPDHAFVASVLRKLAETENILVRRDLIWGMKALDPAVLEDVLPAVAEWVSSSGSSLWMFGHVGEIVLHALRNSQNRPAVEAILDACLEPQREDGGQSPLSLHMDRWEVREFSRTSMAQVVELSGLLMLQVILRKLSPLLEARGREAAGVLDDGSLWWMTDLSKDDYLNGADELLSYLAVQALDAIAKSIPEHARGALELLDSGGWVIHQRLALRLLSRCTGDSSLSYETFRRLADPVVAGAPQFRREYDDLLRSAFGACGSEERAGILAALSSAAEAEGEDAERWLYERLNVVSDDLDEEWGERFAAYAERFGAPRATQPPFQVSWFTPTSPLEAGQAATMGATELAEFARVWRMSYDKPPSERASWAGLAKDVEEEAKRRPSEFSAAAGSFVGANRTVVGAVCSGLKEATRSGETIDWVSTLGLVKKIAHGDEVQDEPGDGGIDEDSSWSDARREALGLIEAGLASNKLPLAVRPLVWETLELLASIGVDPAHFELDNERDSVSLALSATRSEAVYTVVAYLLWVHRSGDEGVPEEVQRFFRGILDPESEPFIGMRVAAAHRLPQLAYVDEGWTAGLVSQIFPSRDVWPDHWDAAWDAYVGHARPLPPEVVLEALEGDYASAVQLVAADHELRDGADPAVSLGIHLVLMFLHGMHELDHPTLAEFFERVSTPTRARILDWVGRAAVQDDLDPAWLSRAQKFFEWRQERVAQDELDASELRKLGWFVAAGVFPTDWWAPRLATALRTVPGDAEGRFIPLDTMLARVADASDSNPKMALDVLGVVVSQNEQGWYEPYLSSAETIVSRAWDVPELKQQARREADRLARAGYGQFERFAN